MSLIFVFYMFSHIELTLLAHFYLLFYFDLDLLVPAFFLFFFLLKLLMVYINHTDTDIESHIYTHLYHILVLSNRMESGKSIHYQYFKKIYKHFLLSLIYNSQNIQKFLFGPTFRIKKQINKRSKSQESNIYYGNILSTLQPSKLIPDSKG